MRSFVCRAVVAGLVALLAGWFSATVVAQTGPGVERGAQSLSFTTITQVSPVRYPTSLAAGDLIHDGKAALGVVGNETTGLSVTLWPISVYSTSPYWSSGPGGADAPLFVIFADVYQHGDLDAVSTDADLPIVATAANNGRGGFNDGQELNVGNCGDSTEQVAVGDLNGDGIPDIVASVFSAIGPGCLAVFLGEGGGKFADAENISSGGISQYSVAIGDLNNDHIPDLVVANGGTISGQGATVAVLLGNGDGTFKAPVTYSPLPAPTQVILADFNGDGNLDAAVLSGGENLVWVALGKGDGTLYPARAYPAGYGPISIVAADFNGDGVLDLAVANFANPKPCYVSVLLGNGDGTFQKPVRFAVGVSPNQLVAADFNGDGKPDIATINNGDSTITILLNTTPLPNEKK